MTAEEKDFENDEGPGTADIEMSFLDHVEELRWRIIYALIGIIIFTIIAWIFIDPLVEIVLLKPARDAKKIAPYNAVLGITKVDIGTENRYL